MKQTAIYLAACLAAASSVRADDERRTLSLDEALRIAADKHPQMMAAMAQTEASSARVRQSMAALLPQVSGSGSYSRIKGRSTSTTTGGAVVSASPSLSGTNSYYQFGLGASELIYDFGQTTGKWKAAKATLGSVEAQQRGALVQLAFNLRAIYFGAASAKALVKVQGENLHNQEIHLAQIQGFVEAGTRPEIDLAQARTNRANAQVQLINAQVNYDTQKALLNQAMGVDKAIDWEVSDTSSQPVPGEDASADTLLADAIKARPDLLALARQIEAQELTTGSIKGGYAPALSANVGVSESGPDLADLVWGASAALTLRWQIFGGGITDAQVRESRANAAVLKAQYELQKQQIRADVEQARLGVRATKAAIDAAHEATENARVRLTLAEGRYQAGVGNGIELNDAQVALTTASGQEVQAIFSLAVARARLMQALGQP
jgi:outer membrane protein